jgi:hypothetical protein
MNSSFYALPLPTNALFQTTSPSDHILVLLQIERLLILQPPPIIFHTRHLLPIIVGNRVLWTAGTSIRPILLDSCVETLLFARDFLRPTLPPGPDSESSISKDRTQQPSSGRDSEGGDPHHDNGVQAAGLRGPGVEILLSEERGADGN